jgi:cation:H+ antiporter
MTYLSFGAGLVLLFIGGEALVRAASAIGQRLHMSPAVAGLTIVALATSAPELAISMGAALNDLPALAIGNVIGSNICNLALILGIITIIRPTPIRGTLIRIDIGYMAVTSLVVPALLLNGTLSQPEAFALLVGMATYLALTAWNAHATRSQRHAGEHSVPHLSAHIGLNLLIAAGGVFMLVTGSNLFVNSAVEIAELIGVPTAVVGLSAAALGSSLPELSASIIAARHGQPEMAAGNLIGSNIFNLLLILGATGVIRPLEMRSVTDVDLGVMVAITALALFLILTRKHLHRTEGAVLIAAYLLYMTWLFVMG